jgi:ketosteroid isomerase-like protein
MSKDIEELTALNRDYVASVQNGDVERFDEILAPEFYCTNPDKSLVDRAGFLRQTAEPVTIRNLLEHDVKIRVMGDFAIIHGATSYTTPDGKQAHAPIAGRGRTAAGWRSPPMYRGDRRSFRGARQREPGSSRRIAGT